MWPCSQATGSYAKSVNIVRKLTLSESLLTLSCPLSLGLLRILSSLGFNQRLYAVVIFPIRAACPVHQHTSNTHYYHCHYECLCISQTHKLQMLGLRESGTFLQIIFAFEMEFTMDFRIVISRCAIIIFIWICCTFTATALTPNGRHNARNLNQCRLNPARTSPF